MTYNPLSTDFAMLMEKLPNKNKKLEDVKKAASADGGRVRSGSMMCSSATMTPPMARGPRVSHARRFSELVVPQITLTTDDQSKLMRHAVDDVVERIRTQSLSGGETPRRHKPWIEDAPLAGVKVIFPKIFPDERGFFTELYNKHEWSKELGLDVDFVQDSHSYSKCGVLRGLHGQADMGKLVTVVLGEIFDVAVDARPDSPSFGRHFSVRLDGRLQRCFWIPPGFLHGFQVLSPEGAHVSYKCTATVDHETEFGADPFDPDIGIQWPDVDGAVVSERDRSQPPLVAYLQQSRA